MWPYRGEPPYSSADHASPPFTYEYDPRLSYTPYPPPSPEGVHPPSFQLRLGPAAAHAPPAMQHSSIRPAVESSLWTNHVSFAADAALGKPGGEGAPPLYAPHQPGHSVAPSTSSAIAHYTPFHSPEVGRSWPPLPATVGDLLSTLPPTPLPTAASILQGNGARLPDLAQPDKVKPFISILYSILSDQDSYRDCLAWDEDGTAFIVSHNDRLIKDVLPRHFQHSNLQSFTRQLNVYEFVRLSTPELLEKLDLTHSDKTTNYSGWSHPAFTRDGDRSRLATMKPRPSKARMLKKMEKVARLEEERNRRRGSS